MLALGIAVLGAVTLARAARVSADDMVLGNVIGSNIFNVLGILGITALVTPLAVYATYMALLLRAG